MEEREAYRLLEDGCFGVAEASKWSGVGEQTLRNCMNDGTLEFVQSGKRKLIPRLALQRMLALNLHGGGRKVDTNPRTRNGRTTIHTTEPLAEGHGFYWHCLDCKAMNEAATSPMEVECLGCHRKYRLEPLEDKT